MTAPPSDLPPRRSTCNTHRLVDDPTHKSSNSFSNGAPLDDDGLASSGQFETGGIGEQRGSPIGPESPISGTSTSAGRYDSVPSDASPLVVPRLKKRWSGRRRSWLLGTVAREGLANARLNPLRTFALLSSLTVAFTLIGLRELNYTATAEDTAEADRRAGRDVGTLISPSTDTATIDTASCVAIADTPGINRVGAVLAQHTVTSNVGVSFPLYTVTPGLLDIATDTHLDLPAATAPSVVLSNALAGELGVTPGRHIIIDDRTFLVTAVASTELRNPALARAAFVLAPPVGYSTSCVVEGVRGTRAVLSSLFASILYRRPDATFAVYVSDKDLHHPDTIPGRSTDVLAAAAFVILTLLVHRRFRSAEAAVYTANGCRALDRWWLAITEATPTLIVGSALSAAIVTGVGDHLHASHTALTDGLEGTAAAACIALVLIALVATIPFGGSLLARLKDRT